MLLPCRAILPTATPPCLTLPHRKRQAVDILEVVFSTTGDLIRVHSYDTGCSATWDTVLTYGRLADERGDGTVVASGRTSGHGSTASALLPLGGWRRSRLATAPGWLGRPLASNGTMTEAMG
jgi:hypothetical protein